MRQLRESSVSADGRSPDEVIADLRMLRRELDDLDVELAGRLTALAQQKDKRKVMRILRGALEGVAGAAIGGADGAAAVGSLGLAAGVAAVAGLLGGAMIAEGVDRVKDDRDD